MAEHLHELMVLLYEIEVVLVAEDILVASRLRLAHSSSSLIIFIGQHNISPCLEEGKDHHLIVSYYQ